MSLSIRKYCHDRNEKRWVSVEGGRVNLLTGDIERSGVEVGVGAVPVATLEREEEFWVCDTCGKVYWQGSHWARAQDRIKGVFTATQSTASQ